MKVVFVHLDLGIGERCGGEEIRKRTELNRSYWRQSLKIAVASMKLHHYRSWVKAESLPVIVPSLSIDEAHGCELHRVLFDLAR